MKPSSVTRLASGLLLLALAAGLVPCPRPVPQPELPETPPFSAGERIALILPNPAEFPPPESLGLVQRAHAAGAQVRVFVPGDLVEDFAPNRTYQSVPWPNHPAGYHPDQWPALPTGEESATNNWHLLVLNPGELAVKNAAVLAAARVFRESGADDTHGTHEIHMLSQARRAEIYWVTTP